MPAVAAFETVILRLLKEAGGPVKREDLYEPIADALGLTPSQREQRCHRRPNERYFHERAGAARDSLSRKGFLDGSRGVWRITGDGVRELLARDAAPLPPGLLARRPLAPQRSVKEELWKAGTGQRIERLYAWVAIGPDGGEGLVSSVVPGMPGWTPLIGADRERIESYRGLAAHAAKASGYSVILKVFENPRTLEEIET